ncbi:hypothetical protein CcaverHIS002_0101150 [Cutaneotrichosporon cavernicola]|nr:hypothetical protein CcaverHIS002_0101150 [Cutaneotrichosporon cavernicola]
MPQPPLDVHKYFNKPLWRIADKYPPGTGGTGARKEWPEGTLTGVEVIEDFDKLVLEYFDKFPKAPIYPSPYYKYPKFVQVEYELPEVFKTSQDLQKALAMLPLSCVAAALPTDASTLPVTSRTAVRSLRSHSPPKDANKIWKWRFSKSPLGSGELLLVKGLSNDVNMVVRTINPSAFTSADWEEFVVTGPYRYNTKSKASWYWSRTWGCVQASRHALFNDDESHGWVSPILDFNTQGPTVLQALFYWTQSSIGAANGFTRSAKDVSELAALFPDTPARRVSISGKQGYVPRDARQVKKANESDIEESDAEDH